MLDALLTAAFDSTPSKLEAAGPPLRACLRAASQAAARHDRSLLMWRFQGIHRDPDP